MERFILWHIQKSKVINNMAFAWYGKFSYINSNQNFFTKLREITDGNFHYTFHRTVPQVRNLYKSLKII